MKRDNIDTSLLEKFHCYNPFNEMISNEYPKYLYPDEIAQTIEKIIDTNTQMITFIQRVTPYERVSTLTIRPQHTIKGIPKFYKEEDIVVLQAVLLTLEKADRIFSKVINQLDFTLEKIKELHHD